MRRSASKPVTPDQRVRDLHREFRGFDKQEPGPERAGHLADFTRAAHADRQLNLAMHTAVLCLEEDPDAPDLLVAAYTDDGNDPEERLHALADLRDLARYIDRPELSAIADERLRASAADWVEAGDDGERRYRLRTVQSIISREVADDIRDALRRTD